MELATCGVITIRRKGTGFEVLVAIIGAQTAKMVRAIETRVSWLHDPLLNTAERAWIFTASGTDNRVRIGPETYDLKVQDGADAAARALFELVEAAATLVTQTLLRS